MKEAIAPAIAAGPDYNVNDPVVADGYMYRFAVTSTYGPFEVTGTGALGPHCHDPSNLYIGTTDCGYAPCSLHV